VEYRPHRWYPLDEDGFLPAHDSQTKLPLLGRRLKWSELPGRTRVGWRGPMMLLSDAVKKMPRVYWA
jgi:hypothetical protein